MRKRFTAIAMGVVLAAGLLAGCGSKEQTVTYQMESESNGLVMLDTMTFDAVGDKVEQLTEVLEIDMSEMDADSQALLAQTYDEIIAMCEDIEGAEVTSELEGSVYRLHIVVDTTGDAPEKLTELGLLSIDGDSDGISLKATKSALEEGGYTQIEK